MRTLRVVGLDDDGKSVICEDPASGERFAIPADERLRAAARGDLTRLGQIAIELESQMRPREIQARIRAGESVEQVAKASGLPPHRVERYAYPVLLERSRMAELAQRAHPVREDGPDVQPLGEVLAHTFGLRGQDYSAVTWDSWRGDDGKWVVELRWAAGRSDNRAHWVFHPGAHGGTVTALDDQAVDLMDPNPNRPLRTVRPVTQLARQALELEVWPESVTRHSDLPEPEILAQDEPDLPVGRIAPADPIESLRDQPGEVVAPPAPSAEGEHHQPAPARKVEGSVRRGGKKNHPIVPSWEDVLLGVRSNRG
ncbi:septation protein SepH [Goodfellowiella coeruleoviolacea]|uniref:DUF3071 domain-containing protein n=1 Tax=Goodfellowiella coeruleoviolacea TaxID=334858 RepID=A0AAE3GKE9_9PSEU|nr:septation protein SepH [Goodfellowiella coeruleoviolacea]MCP2169233.1 Protein of unknown function (DUF3071) [Goodfellowiella coeruleoviolacea]